MCLPLKSINEVTVNTRVLPDLPKNQHPHLPITYTSLLASEKQRRRGRPEEIIENKLSWWRLLIALPTHTRSVWLLPLSPSAAASALAVLRHGAKGRTDGAVARPASPRNLHEPWRLSFNVLFRFYSPGVVYFTEHICAYDLNKNIGFPRLLPWLVKPQCPFHFLFDSSPVSLCCASQGAWICLSSLSGWSWWVLSVSWEKLSVSAPAEGNRCWRSSALFLMLSAPSTLK